MSKSIDVVGWDYDIHEVDSEELGGDVGRWFNDFVNRSIFIDKDQPQEEKESTLIHETFHGIDHHFDIGLQEPQIMKLERAWYYMLTKVFKVDLSEYLE